MLLLSITGQAESIFPEGCQAVAVQGEGVTIKVKKNKMVFIHNLTQSDLWLTHPIARSTDNPGWTSRVKSGNWSALALLNGPFTLNCIESRPGHEQQIPCEGAIAVCQWKTVKFPVNPEPTYWAAEDMSLAALTASIGGKGYVLPSKKDEE